MKIRTWLSLLLILIPAMMMINVHQSKIYQQTQGNLELLIRKQNNVLEENQQIIAEISRSSSPTIVEALAQSDKFQLEKIKPDKVLRIILPEYNPNP